jgi:hypothetical protein
MILQALISEILTVMKHNLILFIQTMKIRLSMRSLKIRSIIALMNDQLSI